MKRVLIITAALAAILLGSCELFLAPKQPRTNPNDPENPVPAMAYFSAVAVSESKIKLTLAFPEESGNIAGFRVLRRKDKAPDWYSDNSEDVALIVFPEGETEYTDGNDLSPNTEYWYSVWTYGADDLDEHFTFSGSDSAVTLDPETTLGTFDSFNAYPTTANEIYLEWNYSGGSSNTGPASFMLVRKAGTEAPADPYDGEQMFVYDNWQFWDYGVEPDTDYTYSIWPTDEDGTPYPPESLNQYQSASDSASTIPVEIPETSISVTIASLDNSDRWREWPANLPVSTGGDPENVVLLRFDIDYSSVAYYGSLDSATLYMRTSGLNTGGPIEVSRIIQDWDGESNYVWSYVTGGVFTADDEDLGDIVTTIADIGVDYGWDVTELMERDTRGYLVHGQSGGTVDATFESGVGQQEPWLVVEFYGEL